MNAGAAGGTPAIQGAEETLNDHSPKKARWRRLLSVLAYVIYFLAFLEVASRLFISIDPLFLRISRWSDYTFRISWVKRHGGPEEKRYSFDVYHPTRGWALKAGIKDMRVFEGEVLNSNSRGVRGRSEYAYDRQPGKRRIVVLGDSFTFGEEVSDDETYPHYLETLLPDTEVINLGVHGYGHDQMLLYFKEEGIKYRPDIVILGHVEDDVGRNYWSFWAAAKPKFELRSDGLHLTHVPVPTPESVLAREPYQWKTLDLVLTLWERLSWMGGRKQRKDKEVTDAIFDEIASTSRQIGAHLLFVYLTGSDGMGNAHKNLTKDEQFLDSYCQRRALPCLFLRPRFQEEIRKGTQFNRIGHWHAPAHMTAAQGIRDYLLSAGWLDKTTSRGDSPGG